MKAEFYLDKIVYFSGIIITKGEEKIKLISGDLDKQSKGLTNREIITIKRELLCKLNSSDKDDIPPIYWDMYNELCKEIKKRKLND